MGKIRRKKPIDFVIIWVDGNDPKWRAVKNQYDPNPEAGEDDQEVRMTEKNGTEIGIIFNIGSEQLKNIHRGYVRFIL